jgi:hypothetical protein
MVYEPLPTSSTNTSRGLLFLSGLTTGLSRCRHPSLCHLFWGISGHYRVLSELLVQDLFQTTCTLSFVLINGLQECPEPNSILNCCIVCVPPLPSAKTTHAARRLPENLPQFSSLGTLSLFKNILRSLTWINTVPTTSSSTRILLSSLLITQTNCVRPGMEV